MSPDWSYTGEFRHNIVFFLKMSLKEQSCLIFKEIGIRLKLEFILKSALICPNYSSCSWDWLSGAWGQAVRFWDLKVMLMYMLG